MHRHTLKGTPPSQTLRHRRSSLTFHVAVCRLVEVRVAADGVLRDFLLKRRGVNWRGGVLRLFGAVAAAGGVARGDAAGLWKG